MADNYKILGQATAASIEPVSGENQAETLYTVPENTQAAISSISLVNTAEENVEYSLGVVKAEDVESSTRVSEGFSENPLYVIALYGGTSYNSTYNSTDGTTWTLATMPSNQNWNAVAHGNGRFVMVEDGGSASAYSTNGIFWTESTLPDTGSWKSITYGGGKFLAIAGSFSSDLAAYSTDGASWTQSYKPTQGEWKEVTYGDGKFVAIARYTNSNFLSTDGITWSTGFLSTSSQSITYGDNKFIAINWSGTFNYSTDAISWNTSNSIQSANWASVAYGNGKFVAIASSGYGPSSGPTAASSTDGISWQEGSLPSASEWISIAYGNEKFVAISKGSSPKAASSTDGISWSEESLLTQGAIPRSIAYGMGFVGNGALTVLPSILASQTIIPTRSIEPNVVDEIVGGITLSAGDQIRVYSESEDLIVQVYGVEIA